MSQESVQNSFFDWFDRDLRPSIEGARKVLAPHITKFYDAIIKFEKGLKQFIIENEESINGLIKFAEVYPKLEPYIKNIIKEVDNPDFDIANDVLSMSDIIDAIDLKEDPQAVSLLTLISGTPFQDSIIEFYKNLPLDQNRTALIEEALMLHNNGFYGGSICLLYGLIEGVLTESFEKANYLIIKSNKINPVNKQGQVDNRKNLTGLVPKLDHAIQHQDQLKSYYEKIKGYKLVTGDPDQTIPRTRNLILHGNSVDFNTEKRSAQLILWLYSALLNISNIVI